HLPSLPSDGPIEADQSTPNIPSARAFRRSRATAPLKLGAGQSAQRRASGAFRRSRATAPLKPADAGHVLAGTPPCRRSRATAPLTLQRIGGAQLLRHRPSVAPERRPH